MRHRVYEGRGEGHAHLPPDDVLPVVQQWCFTLDPEQSLWNQGAGARGWESKVVCCEDNCSKNL